MIVEEDWWDDEDRPRRRMRRRRRRARSQRSGGGEGGGSGRGGSHKDNYWAGLLEVDDNWPDLERRGMVGRDLGHLIAAAIAQEREERVHARRVRTEKIVQKLFCCFRG